MAHCCPERQRPATVELALAKDDRSGIGDRPGRDVGPCCFDPPVSRLETGGLTYARESAEENEMVDLVALAVVALIMLGLAAAVVRTRRAPEDVASV